MTDMRSPSQRHQTPGVALGSEEEPSFRCLLKVWMDPIKGATVWMVIEDFIGQLRLPQYTPSSKTPLAAVIALDVNKVMAYRMAGANNTLVLEAPGLYIEHLRAMLSPADQAHLITAHQRCCLLDLEINGGANSASDQRKVSFEMSFTTPILGNDNTISRLQAAIDTVVSDPNYNPQRIHRALGRAPIMY